MQRFWNTIIKPVVEILQPASIVEIGSDAGGNTENLLEFCRRNGATLHVIDPLPKYDVAEWEERHGGRLVFHEALSLDALPRIDGFDVVLVDGDHNWYTVTGELRLIRERCEQLSIPFPLVMLHDTGWPYGRRDLYYDPDTIPKEYRKPYARKGLLPGHEGLLERGGLNPHLCNALRENEPKSGVLTAIEDFMQETDLPLGLYNVPGMNGLGLLVPRALEERNSELAGFLKALRLPEPVAALVERVERERVLMQVSRQEQRETIRRLKSRLDRKEQTDATQ